MTFNEREEYDLSVEANIRDAEEHKRTWRMPKRDDNEHVPAKSWRRILDERTSPGSADYRPY